VLNRVSPGGGATPERLITANDRPDNEETMSDAFERPKLWLGEFRYPEECTTHLEHFFLDIQKCAPEALRALRDQTRPVLVGMIKEDDFLLKGDPQAVDPTPRFAGVQEAVCPLIQAWAEEFHLAPPREAPPAMQSVSPGAAAEGKEAPSPANASTHCRYSYSSWLFYTAEWSAVGWALQSEVEQELKWYFPLDMSSEELFYLPRFIRFRAAAWRLFKETRSEAETRMLNELKAQLRTYLDYREMRAKRKGLRQRPRKFEAAHLEWLVRRQVQGWSYTRLSKQYKKVRSTVEHGVKAAAELVFGPDWRRWLRANCRPGRPRQNPG
jgi:hypothetical protein